MVTENRALWGAVVEYLEGQVESANIRVPGRPHLRHDITVCRECGIRVPDHFPNCATGKLRAAIKSELDEVV